MDVKLIFQLVQVEFKVPKWGRRDTEYLGWGRGHPAYLQGNAGGQENLTTYLPAVLHHKASLFASNLAAGHRVVVPAPLLV